METTVMGLRVNYEIQGQGDTVLLLHGWGSSLAPYRPLMAQLSAKYRVIALDFPGFGGSEEPKEPWDVEAYARFTLQFLEQFRPQRLALVGHSYGGRVILKLASRETPWTLTKIVLIDSAGIKPPASGKKSARQRIFKLGKWFFSRKPMAKLFPNALEKLRVKFGSADYAAASPMMRQCLVKAVNEDLSHLLPHIKAPTLLVWGDRDTATPLSDARRMEQEIPNAGLALIPGAGHFSFAENPYLFGRIMASYFGLE